MRSYIRHPSDIPIQIKTAPVDDDSSPTRLTNVSHGGLAFESNKPIRDGTLIRMYINLVNPGFQADGVVTHCHVEAGHYVIGVQFVHQDDLFVARMVEQVCHIEHYKRLVAQREGRKLTGQQAAREWIAKYAATFPQWT